MRKAEDELRMPYVIRKNIRVNLVRINQIMDGLLPSGITYDRDRVQNGHMGDRYAAAMAKVYDLEEKNKQLQAEQEWYENVRIPLLLEQVFSPEAKTVIELHDVMNVAMAEVAEIMYMSRATAYRLRTKGLEDIEGYMKVETPETVKNDIL